MTISNRRRFLTLTAAALAAPALPRLARRAGAWPAEKTIRAIVPFTAGSTIDILGRIVLDPLSRQLGQTIVIENRGGAGGSIGSAQVAKADPDGYTLLINAAAHSGAPAAYPNLPYDAAKDFSGVACFGSVPNVLLISPEKGIKTIKEFVAKAKEGNMTFCLRRRRQRHPLGGRALPHQRRFQGDACAVPRRTGTAHRSDDRPRRFLPDRHFVRPALHQERQDAGARGRHRRNARRRCRTCRPRWRPATRIPITITGPACWCRPRRRAPIVDRLHAEVTKVLALPDVRRNSPNGRRAVAAHADRDGRHEPARDRSQFGDRPGGRAEV